jgi:hypothetical protein
VVSSKIAKRERLKMEVRENRRRRREESKAQLEVPQ